MDYWGAVITVGHLQHRCKCWPLEDRLSNTEMKEQYNKDLYALHLDGKMMTILS